MLNRVYGEGGQALNLIEPMLIRTAFHIASIVYG
jgi:hypothetical protein